MAAALVVAVGVTIPLQVIPLKKEEAAAMVAPRARTHRPPQYGLASWYGDGQAGKLTASGAVFRPEALTAAHRWLPLGTKVKVTRLGSKTKRVTVVTVNDRGPYVGGRLIDLSPAAARQLAMLDKGVARVRVDVVEEPPGAPRETKQKPGRRQGEIASQPPAPAKPASPPSVDPKAAPAPPDSNTHFP